MINREYEIKIKKKFYKYNLDFLSKFNTLNSLQLKKVGLFVTRNFLLLIF